ncbi:MAG: DUF389 domain-containing protein [Bacteroidota bacterium]
MEPIQPKKNRGLQQTFSDFWAGIVEWFSDFIHLETGVDREGTIISIKKNTKMRGPAVWLLICSIMVASLGLDLNSSAVIIGAMLISPLMSPILGVGLAVGINDKNMLAVSLQHYGVAILIALFTSFIYFKLTPFGDVTEQISMRTKPTTLDVLVAFFGGVAGIISGSRKDQPNAIPGVAIATALMPPLCVTGFGLATGQWQIMLNSFYLFFFNAFFVALATFLIVRLLKFDEKEYATAQERRRTHALILGFSILMIVPSTFILLGVLDDLERKRKVNAFVTEFFSGETNCIGQEIKQADSTQLVVLKLIGKTVPRDSLLLYNSILDERLEGPPVLLRVIQDSDVDKSELTSMKNDLQSIRQVADRLQNNYEVQVDKEEEMARIRIQMDSLNAQAIPLQQLAQDAKLFLPDLKTMSFARMQATDFNAYQEGLPTLLVEWTDKRRNRSDQENQLRQFVQQRAGLDTLRIISY